MRLGFHKACRNVSPNGPVDLQYPILDSDTPISTGRGQEGPFFGCISFHMTIGWCMRPLSMRRATRRIPRSTASPVFRPGPGPGPGRCELNGLREKAITIGFAAAITCRFAKPVLLRCGYTTLHGFPLAYLAASIALSPFPPLAFKPTAQLYAARPCTYSPPLGSSLPVLSRASGLRL